VRVRTVLILTAIVSSILGATAAYFALTVPNDVNADAMLKKARQELSSGKNDSARKSLTRIVQQYPRTNAAAAATVALVTIADQERQKLQGDLATLRIEHERQTAVVRSLQRSVAEITKKPAAPAAVKTAPKPAAKKVTPKKPTPKKKVAPKKKTTRRRG
jgi:TolA-binding protein